MINQVKEDVLSAFKDLHPGAQAFFTFDQSTNHAAFASDALRASKMNLKPGGAQARLRQGKLSDGTPQSMVFDHDHPLSGQAKGLQQVLLERGYDIKELKMPLTCKQPNVGTNRGDVLLCCARHCMASQEDFRIQMSLLEETIIQAGHICAFLPNLGYDYELTKFAHKKYKSHRRIPQLLFQEKEKLVEEMQSKREAK
ncbi:hypothetical protein H310_09635 [Aphanomyces invadans]|uniref:Uncharacterized protein n=1 Tax=Aphanomyces invadans TaxID=157072 RepID=A0A024TTD4_9STRA|nr:hypothetical protein H310_09635 [Aphanomyces invadans]ETV97279.1 hypothetical protein H310_09635 [Aphanomyces invadans]|eukprot:XP_008873987.1 hypothetical protein H310_09635 [Aphanomyces invadans]